MIYVWVDIPNSVAKEAIEALVVKNGYDITTDLQARTSVAVRDLSNPLEPYPLPPPCPALAFVSDSNEEIVKVLRLGYLGYLRPLDSKENFIKALKVVSRGELWAERRLLARIVRSEPSVDSLEQLTPRQRQVFECIVLGLSNKAIASRLGIQEKTVKGFASSVYEKLEVGNRKELIANFK